MRLRQQELGHAQKQAPLRLLQRGTISENTYADLRASIDDLLRSPSTRDWILKAQLRERPSSEQDPGGQPEAGA